MEDRSVGKHCYKLRERTLREPFRAQHPPTVQRELEFREQMDQRHGGQGECEDDTDSDSGDGSVSSPVSLSVSPL